MPDHDVGTLQNTDKWQAANNSFVGFICMRQRLMETISACVPLLIKIVYLVTRWRVELGWGKPDGKKQVRKPQWKPDLELKTLVKL